MSVYVQDAINAVYVVAVLVFILALQAMSRPETARRGYLYAGVAMLLAVVVTIFSPGLSNFALIALGVGIGGLAGWYLGARR